MVVLHLPMHFSKAIPVFIVALFLSGTRLFCQAEHYTDSLKNVLKTLTADTDRIKCLNKIAAVCKDSDCVRNYTDQVFALVEKSGYKKGEEIAYGILGNFFQRIQINFLKSVRYYTAALKIAEELNDKRTMATCYLQLAITDGQFKNYKKALGLLRKAEVLNIETQNTNKLKVDYTTEAQMFILAENWDSALFYFRKAASIPGQTTVFTAVNYINMISAFIGRNDLDSAILYIHKTDSIYHNVLHNEYGVLWDKMNYGQICLIRGDVKKAIVNLETAYDYGEKTNNGDLLLNVLPSLIDAYRKDGDFAKGFKVQTEWIHLNDSLKATDISNAVLAQQIKFEDDEKDKIEKLVNEKKDAENKAEMKHQKIIIYYVSGFSILALGMAFFIFRSYRQKKKANIIITEQKEEVEKQKSVIEEKQREILDSIHYAKRIQQSLLPTEKYIDRQLKKINRKDFQ